MTEPRDRLRVLTVSSESPGGISGLEATVGRITEGLRARGHHVDVIASGGAVRPRRGERRQSDVAAVFPEVETLQRAFDVIHAHGPCPTLSDALLTRLNRGRRGSSPAIVYTHHFNLQRPGLGAVTRPATRGQDALARRAQRVVATTPSYAQALQATMGRPVEVIPWGVDSERFQPSIRTGDWPLRVLLVGQVRHDKGVSVLMDAVDGIRGLQLTLAGSGVGGQEHRQRSRTMPNVDILGPVDDDTLVGLYRDHDVIALPSVSPAEALGLVLLEGMASGCVPVVSDLVGVRDIAGSTGCLVPAGDAIALRTELLDLATDPARRVDLARRSVERARRFSWDLTVDGYERLLLEVSEPGSASQLQPTRRPLRAGP